MAGSVKWMVYTRDNGETCAMRVDESNGEQGGFADVTADGAPEPYQRAKASVRKRVDADGGGVLKIGDPENELYVTGGTFTKAGRTFSVTSSRGERSVRVTAIDSGVTDGDPT